jgi:hypothetical protein
VHKTVGVRDRDIGKNFDTTFSKGVVNQPGSQYIACMSLEIILVGVSITFRGKTIYWHFLRFFPLFQGFWRAVTNLFSFRQFQL